MEINYNIKEFNHINHFYFLDGENYFEIKKDISKEQLYELNRKYYRRIDNQLFKYLFEDDEFSYEYSCFKFLVFDLDNIDFYNRDSFLQFVYGLFDEVEILDLRNKTILFYFKNYELDLKNIFKAVNDDLGVDIKIFESGKINIKHKNAFRILFESYLKNGYNNSRVYTTISELILDIAKYDINKLKQLKPIILNKVYKDTQLEKLIFSMFDNNLNVTKTAKDVFMHRNTIINKLEVIKNETSLSIQKFQDAVAMYLLLKY